MSKRKKREEANASNEDFWVKRPYEIGAIVYSNREDSLNLIRDKIIEKFDISKNNVYLTLTRLEKQGKIIKKDGKITMTQSAKDELEKVSLMIYEEPLKRLLQDVIRYYKERSVVLDPELVKFVQNSLPRVIKAIMDFLGTKLPQGVLPKDTDAELQKLLENLFFEEHVKSQFWK